MHERIDQLNLGLNFESKPALEAASESVMRQYLDDYGAGEFNLDAWQNIANAHTEYTYMIRVFMGMLSLSWTLQKLSGPLDPRFEAMEAVRLSQRTKSSDKSSYAYMDESININFIEDLLWMRTSKFDSTIHSSYLVDNELDDIYGQITPAAILEDDLGNVEFPNLQAYPLQSLIGKVLKNEIFMDSPAFLNAE